MKSALLYLCLVAFSCYGQESNLPQVNYGKTVRWSAYSSAFVNQRNIDIWLPPEYDQHPEKKFPVIYFQDGQNLFDAKLAYGGVEWGVDEWMEQLSRNKSIEPAIVVGIWNTPLRFREYMPQKAFDLLGDSVKNKLSKERGGTPLSDEYLKFVTTELIPAIDDSFRTQNTRSGRVLCGSSMGGMISLYTLVSHPEYFGAAACVSTHWPGSLVFNTGEIPLAMQQWLDANIPKKPEYRLYFDHGTTQLDSWYPQWQKEVDEILVQKEFQKGEFVSLQFEGAGHNEKSWNERLGGILEFLIPNKK